jgi:excinuclease ABC subunit A
MLLAPVIRERKGEHVQVFENLRAQGFVRVRVDGQAVRARGSAGAGASPEAHDRGRGRPFPSAPRTSSSAWPSRSRPACASATAWRSWRTSTARRRPRRSTPRAIACPICDYSLSELEPRLFSFNSPVGACPSCDGLGVKQVFDPERVVAHPERSLAAGAVRGWDKRNPYYFQMIQSLARHYRFDLDTPWDKLPKATRNAILDGSGDEAIAFNYIADSGRQVTRRHRFEGIIPNLERRYRETESAVVREELAKFIADKPCPECNGERLGRAARHVFVADRNLPAVCRLPVDQALDHFQNLALAGWRGEIADKIVKEIRERLRFLADVGLDYLTLERSANSLSGGEAQRIRLASQIGAGSWA